MAKALQALIDVCSFIQTATESVSFGSTHKLPFITLSNGAIFDQGDWPLHTVDEITEALMAGGTVDMFTLHDALAMVWENDSREVWQAVWDAAAEASMRAMRVAETAAKQNRGMAAGDGLPEKMRGRIRS